jgi:deoxyhypusine synthase
MVSAGANLYHDAHFGIGLKRIAAILKSVMCASPEGVVRIYDIFFDYHVRCQPTSSFS